MSSARQRRPTANAKPSADARPLPRFGASDDEREDWSDLEKTLKRLPAISADSTGEIRADDILEAVDAPAEPRNSESRQRSVSTPTSIRPVAFELPPPPMPPRFADGEGAVDVTFDADATAPARARLAAAAAARRSFPVHFIEQRPPKRRIGMLVAGSSLAIALVGAALVQRGVTADAAAGPIVVSAAPRHGVVARDEPAPPVALSVTSVTTATASADAPPARADVPTNAHGDVPIVDITALPRPSTGTVIGAPAHRLFIDGHVAATSTAKVPCGRHVVQVGSAGKPHPLDVPCGGEIVAPH